MYETFEHTADVGIRARGETLSELFAEAARGLYSLLIDNPEDVKASLEQRVRLEAADCSYLLFDWLTELLYLFESEHFLAARLDVSVEGTRLHAAIAGEMLDGQRHRPGQEVKAITYHRLQVRRKDHGWEATVVVDV